MLLVRTISWVAGVFLIAAQCLLSSCSSVGETSVPNKPPPAPENINIELVNQGAAISWKCVRGTSHYTLFWGVERGDYRALANTNACSTILAGLKKGDLYYFAVSSWNARGESGYSQEQAFLYDDAPERAGVYLERGSESAQKGLYAEAHAYLSAAIRLDPGNAEAYRQRAALHEQLNQSEYARQDYQMAEKIFKTKSLSTRQSNQ
jgi:tetratricopeptide (TPR) repeat protein